MSYCESDQTMAQVKNFLYESKEATQVEYIERKICALYIILVFDLDIYNRNTCLYV